MPQTIAYSFGGGQFEPDLPGQFTQDWGGQLRPDRGGNIERIFQLTGVIKLNITSWLKVFAYGINQVALQAP